jgi:hypothetical protein
MDGGISGPERREAGGGIDPAGGQGFGVGVLLGLIALVAAVPRLFDLGYEALWFDEVNTLYRASAEGLVSVLARTAADVQAPFYDLVSWVVAGPLGRTDAAGFRFPAALFGIALVPVGGALALALTGQRAAAVLAALLLAFSPYQIRFAQEARPYTLLALLSGLLLLGAMRALTSGGRRGLLLVVLSSPLLVLTHYYGVLMFGAVALVLLISAARYGARLPRVAWALIPALLALLAWSPAALRQMSLREMNTVYGPLDAPMLMEILDAQGVAASLRTAPSLLDLSIGSLAPLAPWGLWLGRALLLVLLVAGWRAVRRGKKEAGDTAREAPGSCRAPAIALVSLGVLIAACAALLPDAFVDRVAASVFKGGRVLDEENRAFVAQVRSWMLPVGGALALFGVLVACLPGLARRTGRGPAPALLLQAAVVLPLLAPFLLDLTGKYTLTPRNMIMLAPAAAAIAAAGWVRLSTINARLSAGALCLVAVLGLAAVPAYGVKRDWHAASETVALTGLEVVAYPPWLARCVEYHTDQPWGSVFGAWRPDDVERWAAERQGAVLVSAHATPQEQAGVEAALAARFGPPMVRTLRGITCRVYRSR